MNRVCAFCGVVILAFCGLSVTQPAFSQSPAAPTTEVVGYAGHVALKVNASRRTSLVVFESVVPLDTPSGQMVIALQHDSSSALPRDWTGSARLFVAPGVVAISGTDGADYLFKFVKLDVPESLRGFRMQSFQVFGIARFGEHVRLTAQEIENLLTAGACNAPTKWSPFDEGEEEGQGCDACTSGGQGATSCSGGGGTCSVSCSEGYFACCNMHNNSCRCCS